jgi:transcriptional regulator with XRE-family HTH domain
MAQRIGPKRPKRLYLEEWRKFRDLTQTQAGGRVGVDSQTISRWERFGRGDAVERKPDIDVLAALAEAYGIEPEDFYHHPDKPSANALLRDQPDDILEQAIKLIKAIRKAS